MSLTLAKTLKCPDKPPQFPADVGPTTVQMEDSLKDLRTLSLKQVNDLHYPFKRASPSLWNGYKGTFEGAPVVVLIVEPYLDVTDAARKMLSLSHPYVAKVKGWCRDSRIIVVEGGEGGSLKDRIERGLGWQDCCRIANELAHAVLYLSRGGFAVLTDSEMITFDDNDNTMVVYPPAPAACLFMWYQFGMILREMLVGPLYLITSQAELKTNLDPRVKEWPKVVIDELTRLTAECLSGDVTSMEKVVNETDRISEMAVKQERKLNKWRQPNLEQLTGLDAKLEILVAEQEKLHQDLKVVQERAGKSKAKLLELHQEILIAANSQKDFTFLCDDMKLLGNTMKEERSEEAELQKKLNAVDKDITRNEKMVVDLETAFEEERKLAMTHCESLRSVSLEKRGKIATPLNKYDMEKVASLANEAKALDEKADELQTKYGFKLPMLELKPGFTK